MITFTMQTMHVITASIVRQLSLKGKRNHSDQQSTQTVLQTTHYFKGLLGNGHKR